jgi:hypothetical protein
MSEISQVKEWCSKDSDELKTTYFQQVQQYIKTLYTNDREYGSKKTTE